MYDEPPDPEPNPCPYCEAELGCGEGCDHCAMAAKLSSTESELSTLKHRLACRVRWVAHTPFDALPSPRSLEAIALLLDLGGLKLPEEYVKRAFASMTGEYGEYQPTKLQDHRHVPMDDELAERFMAMAYGSATAAGGTYRAEVLDAKPATQSDQLWRGDDENGVPRIFTSAEKRTCSRAGGTQWGLTLRQFIEKALQQEANGAAFWLEFFREYLQPPKDLVPKQDPRCVRGGDQPKVSYVVGIDAYTAYVGKHKSENWSNQGLGFGGSEFTVRLDDGREFFTDNNWSRGQVPPPLRKLLRSNAVFVKRINAPEAEPALPQT